MTNIFKFYFIVSIFLTVASIVVISLGLTDNLFFIIFTALEFVVLVLIGIFLCRNKNVKH